MRRYDHEAETGIASPVKLTMMVAGLVVLEATGPTAGEALAAMTLLLQDKQQAEGRDGPMERAIDEAAEALNNGTILLDMGG